MSMYAMTGKFTTHAGRRHELVDILLRAADLVSQLPGCRLYLVSEDLGSENCVWVFEMWDDKQAHDSSLTDDRVRGLIAQAMPLLNGAPEGVGLRVAGGYGARFTM